MPKQDFLGAYEMKADQKYYFNIFFYDINMNNPRRDDMVHFHNSLEFVYVAEGSFSVHIQGISYTLNQGDLAYVCSGQIHYYASTGDAKVFVLVVGLDYLDDPIYKGQCQLPTIMTLKKATSEKVTRFLFCIRDIWQYGNVPLAKGIFSTLYGLLYEYTLLEPSTLGSKFPIHEVLKFIDSHYSEKITLKNLSKHFNYSETYFSSSFKAHVNMSLPEYINRIRIGRVNRLIEQGMTKNQAATACGYKSYNTFFRAYKKYHVQSIRDIYDDLDM